MANNCTSLGEPQRIQRIMSVTCAASRGMPKFHRSRSSSNRKRRRLDVTTVVRDRKCSGGRAEGQPTTSCVKRRLRCLDSQALIRDGDATEKIAVTVICQCTVVRFVAESALLGDVLRWEKRRGSHKFKAPRCPPSAKTWFTRFGNHPEDLLFGSSTASITHFSREKPMLHLWFQEDMSRYEQ